MICPRIQRQWPAHQLKPMSSLFILDVYGRNSFICGTPFLNEFEDSRVFNFQHVQLAREEDDGPRVVTRIKGDQTCACVSAASVIAKVERDALMTELHEQFPHYGWSGNKGYGAAVHTDAIKIHGVTDLHRKSWNLGI